MKSGTSDNRAGHRQTTCDYKGELMAAKYERITADLRRKIRTHELAPGEQMPAQTALAEQYRVSVPTIQQALGVLEAEGLIDAVHGIGTYVRVPKKRIRRKADRYQWEKTRALLPLDERNQTGATEHDTGLTMDELDFHTEYRTEDASEELAEAFGIAPGTKLLHRIYRTMVHEEGAAVSLIDSYLIYEMVAANPDLLDAGNEPWPGGTHHQLRTIGIEIDRIVDEITARPPQGDETEELGIGQGVAVLVLRKTSIDTADRVIEISDVIMPGDRTVMVYETPLKRWDT
jgi:GntR family transcriptional regulator